MIEIDSKGKKKVSSKSSKSASSYARAAASVETKENGISKKQSMEAIEEKSATEHSIDTQKKGVSTLSIEMNGDGVKKIKDKSDTGTAEKKKKVRKVKKGDSEKENISVVSVIS